MSYEQNEEDQHLLQIEATIKEISALVNPQMPHCSGSTNRMHDHTLNASGHLRNSAYTISRPLQRKLMNLLKCRLVYCPEARVRLIRCMRSVGERTLTDILLLHQNPVCVTRNLWIAVRNRGCQFLGPAMQEEVLRLILLALEDGSALSRKVLVLFVVQKLSSRYPRASKTSVGHVVQLLYRASCFKLQKREDDSSLMQLKDEFRNYEDLRREHDTQIIQIAMDACLKISPESWSSLLYGDIEHRSQMQSIMDRLQMSQIQSFNGMLRELQNALQRSGDPYELAKLLPDFDYIDRKTKEDQLITENYSSVIILNVLNRIQNLILTYAKVSSLFAMNRQRNVPYNTSNINNFTGSTNSLCSNMIPESNLQASNLCRNWSSMSSVMCQPDNLKHSNHNNIQFIDKDSISVGLQNENEYFSSISNSVPSVNIIQAPTTNEENTFESHPPYNVTNECSQLSLNSNYTTQCFSNGTSYKDDLLPFNNDFDCKNVTWRDRKISPINRYTKLPPRSPNINQYDQSMNQCHFRKSGLPPRRQWMSVNSILNANSDYNYIAFDDTNEGLVNKEDKCTKFIEIEKLIRISKTIQNLEKQKQDILESLEKHDETNMRSRNASSLTNLTSGHLMKPINPSALHLSMDAVGLLSSNDDVIPFSQTPVYNKYGPICRSNRRLAQSLMAFPPLTEYDVNEDQSEDSLYENTVKMVSNLIEEDIENDRDPTSYILKHASSMSAIQDSLKYEENNLRINDENTQTTWNDVLDESDDAAKPDINVNQEIQNCSFKYKNGTQHFTSV